MKQDKKLMEASFTVEAAFVMPIIIFIIAALIFFTFYMHDLCIVEAVVNQSIEEVRQVNEIGGELNPSSIGGDSFMAKTFSMVGLFLSDEEEQKIEKIIKKHLEEQLFFCDIEECDVAVELNQVKVLVRTGGVIHDTRISYYFPKGEFEIRVKARVHQPPTNVRIEKMICDEFKKTKVYEKVKKIIAKFADYME